MTNSFLVTLAAVNPAEFALNIDANAGVKILLLLCAAPIFSLPMKAVSSVLLAEPPITESWRAVVLMPAINGRYMSSGD